VSNPAGTRELALTVSSSTSASLAVAFAIVGVWARQGLAADAKDAADAGLDAGVPARRPSGPLIERAALAPCAACVRACSFRHPLCVEGEANAAAESALAVIDAADRAWEGITSLGAPPPDGGDDGVWSIELRDAVDGGGDAWLSARDPVSRFDRASSAAAVDRALRRGCALDLALARAVARGSQWRAAPAADEASARAEAETLARLVTPCAAGGPDVPAFQALPERTVVDPGSASYERGASAFFGWLDATFGARPGALVVGLWSLAPTRTPIDALRWAASPTGFDVLRESLRGALWAGSTIDDVFVRFAVARARMEPPARTAWHIPWPAPARRLGSSVPVAPTGASYVLVDHGAAPPGSKLRVEADWEDYGRFRWIVVKLDAGGRATGEVPIPSLDRATHASMTLESLDGVDQLLIACVNVGSTEHPFDPDQTEWEPHGWRLTLEGE
jgi:hypothetical protein